MTSSRRPMTPWSHPSGSWPFRGWPAGSSTPSQGEGPELGRQKHRAVVVGVRGAPESPAGANCRCVPGSPGLSRRPSRARSHRSATGHRAQSAGHLTERVLCSLTALRGVRARSSSSPAQAGCLTLGPLYGSGLKGRPYAHSPAPHEHTLLGVVPAGRWVVDARITLLRLVRSGDEDPSRRLGSTGGRPGRVGLAAGGFGNARGRERASRRR